ncbi:MAG: aldehyde ferredoxin oxidoreductase family protein [Candidatus Eremiobacteraeota bacterium]|nr:aldehyde ferredoxin oxidoreductase family protein [Candidatus Eremiobacteraeota bacterium]
MDKVNRKRSLCNGKIVEVNLASLTSRVIEIPLQWYRDFLAGSGMGVRVLFEEHKVPLEPLAPESPLLFMKGLFNGTKIPSSSRVTACARSPLTGIWAESCSGGLWGAELAFTGYDGILVRGKAPHPVYLWINDSAVEIRRAEHLWGLDTFEASDQILKETRSDAKVASIGRAGELGVAFASIMLDGIHARAMGRSGMGAVMGSKNLKSIALKGSQPVETENAEELLKVIKAEVPLMVKNAQGLRNWSTAGGVETIEFLGDLPIKNWQLGSWVEGAKKIAGQAYLPTLLDHHATCYSCAIRCAKIVKVKEGPYKGIYGHGPEYETLAGFGSNLLNENPEVIIAANDLCNRLGMDTISSSSMIAFAMEAYEKGIINSTTADGLTLEWGRGEAIVELTRRIALREGAFARLLGEGVKKAAAHFGGATGDFAIHTKGQEFPYHDPRAFTCMAANYATANRGACHLEALSYFLGRGVPLPDLGFATPPDPHINEGKGHVAYLMQNYMSCFNPLGLCKFIFTAQVGPSQIARWLSLSTGWPVGQDELMKTGERIFTLKRLFNNRLGITKKDDIIPRRLQKEPRPSGRAAGVLPDLPLILEEYYRLRRWDDDGIPTPQLLKDLGLEQCESHTRKA